MKRPRADGSDAMGEMAREGRSRNMPLGDALARMATKNGTTR